MFTFSVQFPRFIGTSHQPPARVGYSKRFFFGVGTLAVLFAVALPMARAEEKEIQRPVVRATECAVTEAGEWVFRLKLEAKGKTPVALTSDLLAEKRPMDEETGPFSLDGVRLVDPATGAEETALPLLPRSKIGDPMQIQTVLRPGGWVSLAVGFARLPEGGARGDEKASRLLEIRIPGFPDPVKIELDPATRKISSK